MRARIPLAGERVTDYAIYMLDPDGLITTWSAGAERIKGYSHAEVLGTHFSRFYTPEDQETGLPKRALKTALAEGRFEQDQGWRVRKSSTQKAGVPNRILGSLTPATFSGIVGGDLGPMAFRCAARLAGTFQLSNALHA